MTLVQKFLGDKPYILITIEADGDGSLDVDVEAGAGLNDRNDVAAVIMTVLEDITGVPIDDYAKAADQHKASRERT